MHIHLPETDSTSNYLKAHAHEMPQYAVVTAGFQTAGRGQRGNGWESQRDENLLMSMLYLPPEGFPPTRQFDISKAVSIAAVAAVEELLADAPHPPVRIKWPNDIYIGDKKAIGILIENTIASPAGAPSLRQCIIGIGANINQREFHSDAPNPVSLITFSHALIPLETARETFIRHLLETLDRFITSEERSAESTSALASAYRMMLWRGRGFHPYVSLKASIAPVAPIYTDRALPQNAGEIFEAEIADVLPSGPLCLRLRDGSVRTFNFKEVSPLL